MAYFVVSFGFTPTDYWNLTTEERDAIIRAANRAARK